MYCRNCGTKNKNNINFCYKCGYPSKPKIDSEKQKPNHKSDKLSSFFNRINLKINSDDDNKYQKIFILISIMTISFVIFMYVFFSTPEALALAIDSIGQNKSPLKVSNSLWIDIWFRIIFILSFGVTFGYSCFLFIKMVDKNFLKNKKK